MEQFFKANTQLMARCTYCTGTGEARYENFSEYYNKKKHNGKNPLK